MKQQRNLLFIVFCLVLTAGLSHFYLSLKSHFSPLKETEHYLLQSKKDLQREKLKVAMIHNQFQDYRFQVAKMLPQKKDWAARQIASVSTDLTNGEHDYSHILMAQGREEFEARNFNGAIVAFKKVLEKYPSSPYSVQAHFFLAESHYLNSEYGESLDVIENMLQIFPDDELTHFILLRMGQIFQKRNRSSEAAEVYKTILSEPTSSRELKEQAHKLLLTAEES